VAFFSNPYSPFEIFNLLLLKWLIEELFMLLVLLWVRETEEYFNSRREAYLGKEDF